MKNTLFNRNAIKKVASALGELNEKVIYVGGAVVSLYINDTAADDVRPTKDVDIGIEIASLSELEELRQTLARKGFHQSHEDTVVCRFRFEDIKVDVMSTQAIGWAPANIWFKKGFGQAVRYGIEDTIIRILPLPYFLASKFSAFYDRGGNDPRASHDFEDIVYLLNYSSNISYQVLNADEEVKTFIKDAFKRILTDALLQEAIICNLYHEDQMTRFKKITSKLQHITEAI